MVVVGEEVSPGVVNHSARALGGIFKGNLAIVGCTKDLKPNVFRLDQKPGGNVSVHIWVQHEMARHS